MQKTFINLNFLIIAFLNLTTICSEKNWLQSKMDAFARKTITLHTYAYNSFEHIRDRALLFALPASTAQGVLMLQRNNMKKFLKQNEENALEGVRKYWNIDKPQWTHIMDIFHKEHNFNIAQMQRTDIDFDTEHDTALPAEWISAMAQEGKRYGINYKNLNLSSGKQSAAANIREKRPHQLKKYLPASIDLNITPYKLPQDGMNHCLKQTASHEFTHLMNGHSIRDTVIVDEITKVNLLLKEGDDFKAKLDQFNKKENPSFAEIEEIIADSNQIKKELQECNYKINLFLLSPERETLVAACEKTADTLIPCTDRIMAKNAYMNIKFLKNAGYKSYPENYNDLKVVYANWQTSQAITDFQQLKNSIAQKLTAFPKCVG